MHEDRACTRGIANRPKNCEDTRRTDREAGSVKEIPPYLNLSPDLNCRHSYRFTQRFVFPSNQTTFWRWRGQFCEWRRNLTSALCGRAIFTTKIIRKDFRVLGIRMIYLRKKRKLIPRLIIIKKDFGFSKRIDRNSRRFFRGEGSARKKEKSV